MSGREVDGEVTKHNAVTSMMRSDGIGWDATSECNNDSALQKGRVAADREEGDCPSFISYRVTCWRKGE